MANAPLLVLTTFPDLAAARAATRTLVEEGLVACGNILPGLESTFYWRGQVDTAEEVLVLLKTEAARYADLEARLRRLHPYEMPELIAVSITHGLPAYLGWISASVNR